MIFSNVRGKPSNIQYMGTPAGKGANPGWTLRQIFGEREGRRWSGRLKKDTADYRRLLFQAEFYQAHAEKFILFRFGEVVAESEDFDALVEGFLPQAEAGYYLICRVSRKTNGRFPPAYSPLPWIFTGWDHDLSEEEVKDLLRENSRWVWKIL